MDMNDAFHMPVCSRHDEAGPDALAKLLLVNSCYEAMPNSGRVVVLHRDLVMWQAFLQIVSHATRHVLLSDEDGNITGILSVTDFIRVILNLFRDASFSSPLAAKRIGSLTIGKYQELVKKAGKSKSLVWISAEESLLDAVRLLLTHRVHRIPVIDPHSSDPIFILTNKRILKFLWCFGQTLFRQDLHMKTPRELGVGTWDNIRFVYPTTPLSECLEILLNLGVSGVPVLEPESHIVIDVYSRFDAIGIAAQDVKVALNATVQEALNFKHICESRRSRVVSVRDTETFYSVVSTLAERGVHRVCVVNEIGVLQGVISLSDVMRFLVLEPGVHLDSRSVPRRRFSQISFDELNMASPKIQVMCIENEKSSKSSNGSAVVAIAYSMPADVKPGGIDECGAKAVKMFTFAKTGDDKMDIACELCLDLVLIAESYAECGEAEVEAALDKKCDKDFSSPATDKLCRSMIDKVAHEVIEDTEQDPSKVCYKVIHKECQYSAV
ncbi:hypothetical protein Q1695_000996 [Nippostrongylus brasiliensis]|nr:hypothetical protein Q1695_000996 [Nippostrongylus brasiliensis]